MTQRLRWVALLTSVLVLAPLHEGMLHAQWQDVAPHLVSGALFGWGGAMRYKDGIVWAGQGDLYYSEDTGRTWKRANLKLGVNELILDISFLNKDTGIVATGVIDGSIYWTGDRGKSFSKIMQQKIGSWNRVVYRSAPRTIVASSYAARQLFFSTDDGANWDTSRAVSGLCFTIASNGTFYMVKGDVSSSTDGGVNWMSLFSGTSAGADSWTIESDLCDSERLYILNENYFSPGDHISKVITSSDAGQIWNVVLSHPTKYFSGSLAVSPHCVFAPTVSDGIMRSTDYGLSWTRCAPALANGGWKNAADSRSICPISDNLIFVLDSSGSIWRTANSGGDSIGASNFVSNGRFSLSTHTLFSGDTVNVCKEDSLVRSVRITSIGCQPVSIAKMEIIGSGSGSYTASTATDTIGVTFRPIASGPQPALLILHMNNLVSDTVALSGTGADPEPLTLVTSDETTDTIGGTVTIPITINGLHTPADVELVVHYNPSLDYLGSVSTTGLALDLVNQQWAGRSKLHMRATSGQLIGYARFTAFSDSLAAPKVVFDSMVVTIQTGPCEYRPAPATSSTITTSLTCGGTMLSRFVHSGQPPEFRVSPNPTSGDVSITSSLDLGSVAIEVYDMLGARRSGTSLVLKSATPATILLALPDGMYTIRLRSTDWTYNLRIIVRR